MIVPPGPFLILARETGVDYDPAFFALTLSPFMDVSNPLTPAFFRFSFLPQPSFPPLDPAVILSINDSQLSFIRQLSAFTECFPPDFFFGPFLPWGRFIAQESPPMLLFSHPLPFTARSPLLQFHPPCVYPAVLSPKSFE